MKQLFIMLFFLLPKIGLEYNIQPYFRIYELPTVKVGATFITEVEYATVYHAVSSQTDDTPLITASGKEINPLCPQNFIAISWDLRDKLSFGDTVYVSNGPKQKMWVVEDLMNKRWKNKIDFLVDTSVYTSYKNVKIWKRTK